MKTEKLERRRATLAALLAEYQQDATDYDEGEEEDPRPYLSGETPCGRWCCVTVNYTSHGYAKFFFLPTFDRVEEARLRATEYAEDDLFEELPVAVVNLDTGARSVPVLDRVPWTSAP